MKHIKWFLLSSFLILFFGVCDIVSALEMGHKTIGTSDLSATNWSWVNSTYRSPTKNFQSNWTETIEFTDPQNFLRITGYDYLNFGILFQHKLEADNNGYIYGTDNQNTSYYCARYVNTTQTYADGTTSLISVCDEWKIDEQSSTIPNYEINSIIQYQEPIYTYIDLIYTNGEVSPCIPTGGVNEGNFYVECKIPDTANYLRSIRIRNIIRGAYTPITGYVGIENNITYWKDPIRYITGEQQETNNQLQDMNDNITSTDVSGASQEQNNLVNNSAFQDNTGLSGIITAPLSMISSLTNQCQPIQLTLPYLKDTNLSIPCMGDFLQQKIPELVTLIKVFVNGFICYLIGLDLFKIVKNARDPDNDRIEVLDL